MSSLFTASEIALATLALGDLPRRRCRHAHRRRRRRPRPRLHRGRGARGHESGVAHGHRSVARSRRLARAPPAPVRPRSSPGSRAAGSCRATSSRWSRAIPDLGADAADRWHAILVDIDHTPRHHLHASHAPFYEPAGLRRLAHSLHPGGVFGLWSDDPPRRDFMVVMDGVFDTCVAHVVTFPNPYTGGESACTVYVAGVGN